jgi:hypothetical protein
MGGGGALPLLSVVVFSCPPRICKTPPHPPHVECFQILLQLQKSPIPPTQFADPMEKKKKKAVEKEQQEVPWRGIHHTSCCHRQIRRSHDVLGDGGDPHYHLSSAWTHHHQQQH